ncbi:MAG: STAS domain-containing protein [Armatimonadetes bacterium]|nr:STAS domain-containing protein [Armatimonadota bacterium]
MNYWGASILGGIRLETAFRDIDGKKVLDVVGEIDVYTAPKFKEAVNQILDAGQDHLLINMAGVTYMDSSGFGALLSATKRLKPKGGTVNLVKCNSVIDRILRITRLNTIFATFDNLDEAVQAINAR